jgi:nicotinamide-nucleotide amidase
MPKSEQEIANLLRQYKAKTGKLPTIGTAESATRGRISDKITNIPGSSDYYKGSLIAYSNEVKIALLGVREETINNHGAVSPQTAIEMAEGGRKLLKVDICLSDTGIAGPSGATPGKPVGLFYIGLSTEQGCFSQEHRFQGTREANKQSAVKAALGMLKEFLSQILKDTEGDKPC